MKNVDKCIRSFLTAVFLLFFAGTILISCARSEPVKIGFVADLSSRNAELGIQGRNGLIMAIEELNESGGVHGRKIEVLIGNHKGDKDLCDEVVRDLIDQGIHIIIGPMMSGMASTVISATGDSNILVIAPTVTTDSLSGIDDNFLRVATTASTQGAYLAQSLLSMGKSHVVQVLDRNNSSYTEAVSKALRSTLSGSDVTIAENIFFDSKNDFPQIVQKLELLKPDSIVFAASGIDAAAIVQSYGKNNDIPQLFGGSWAKVTNVNEYGGKTVEGMIIIDAYLNPAPLKREIEFTENFFDLYSVEPNIAARYSYESVFVFITAFQLSESLKSLDIKNSILGIDQIEGIGDNFRLDQYGDVIRKMSLFIIEDGKYKLVPQLQ